MCPNNITLDSMTVRAMWMNDVVLFAPCTLIIVINTKKSTSDKNLIFFTQDLRSEKQENEQRDSQYLRVRSQDA